MAAPKFTLAELEALEAQGLTQSEAARALGVDASAVTARIKTRIRNGGTYWQGALGNAAKPPVSMQQIEEAEAKGLTMAEAARALGMTQSALCQRITARMIAGGQDWRGNRGWVSDQPRSLALVHDSELAAPATPPVPAGACPALVATGGRYADLGTYATERGISFTEAQRRWHALGIPLRPRRVAHV